MDDDTCKAIPLVEQLRSVPADAVLRIDTPNALGCMDTRSIPVGSLCHEAAAALDAATPASTTGTADAHLHADHPMRHWDRTCPACVASTTGSAVVPVPLKVEDAGHGWRRQTTVIAAPASGGSAVVPAEASQSDRCLPHGLMFDAFGRQRVRYVRVIHDGTTCVVPPGDVADMVDSERPDDYRTEDVYLSKEEFDALPEFDGF